jgi:hypothetical protein
MDSAQVIQRIIFLKEQARSILLQEIEDLRGELAGRSDQPPPNAENEQPSTVSRIVSWTSKS